MDNQTLVPALIAIGSNINPELNIPLALKMLDTSARIRCVSNFYFSAPLGDSEQPQFVNGACLIEMQLSPRKLKFDLLRRIETELGRVRTNNKYAPRTIDLDIACYEEETFNESGLLIPDPDIATRPFLAVPLSEIAPNWSVPGLDGTLQEIAQRVGHEGLTLATELTRQLKERYGR